MRNESEAYKVYVFICKKSGCGKEVKYARKENEGYLAFEFRDRVVRQETEKFRVYLTCENDHTYPYEIG